MPQKIKPLRIAYAIQNVGGIDFSQDVGDTVPVKYTLAGLKQAGHQVVCLKLNGRSVLRFEDVSNLDQFRDVPAGLSGKEPFRLLESGARRLQRELRLPYFAFFDLYRFYEACMRLLPGFTLCHEHNGLFCAGAALACRRLGLPYVLTFSSDPLFERSVVGKPLRGLHYLVAAWEARFTYRLARKIICVSEPARRHLIQTWKVDEEKVVVMANGVDNELFKPGHDVLTARKALGFDDDPVIGFVGGFQPWHGLDLLIESFAIVLKEFPKARLLLIGDGRARPLVDRKIAEMGVESRVIITGLVPKDRVPVLLATADVAVLPYPILPKELWFSPLKLYEYMAAGKAIVASRAGQIAEVIEHGYNGLLVEPGNVLELSIAIMRLLRNQDERDRLGRNARNEAVERHSWDQYIQCLEEIYLSVL
jgi:glycosyltransferase involved in cell wall biosynthesis